LLPRKTRSHCNGARSAGHGRIGSDGDRRSSALPHASVRAVSLMFAFCFQTLSGDVSGFETAHGDRRRYVEPAIPHRRVPAPIPCRRAACHIDLPGGQHLRLLAVASSPPLARRADAAPWTWGVLEALILSKCISALPQPFDDRSPRCPLGLLLFA
jgi:hypothetical protein